MPNHGLRFEVRRYCGTPLISARGQVDAWHMETLRRLLHSFNWKGHQDVIVDLTGTRVAEPDGAQALAELIRTWRPEMSVQMVATGQVARTLSINSFPFRMQLCASLEEAAQYVCRLHRMDETWEDVRLDSMPVMELPKAA